MFGLEPGLQRRVSGFHLGLDGTVLGRHLGQRCTLLGLEGRPQRGKLGGQRVRAARGGSLGLARLVVGAGQRFVVGALARNALLDRANALGQRGQVDAGGAREVVLDRRHGRRVFQGHGIVLDIVVEDGAFQNGQPVGPVEVDVL